MIGEVKRLVVDTIHYKGNLPESILVEACLFPDALDSVRASTCTPIVSLGGTDSEKNEDLPPPLLSLRTL
ncbi:unnamed protein product [Ectocarpus sp. 12 AP-2014]